MFNIHSQIGEDTELMFSNNRDTHFLTNFTPQAKASQAHLNDFSFIELHIFNENQEGE